jgi:hypothetical protein
MTTSLPSDWSLLPPSDQEVINPDLRLLWSSIPPDLRSKALNKAREQHRKREDKRMRQQKRSQACADYIDALCSISELGGKEREAARARLDETREYYLSLRRTK